MACFGQWLAGPRRGTILIHMSTRLEFEPAADWNMQGKVSLTYEGASPTDPGPAGALVHMLIAQLSQDEAGLKATVTERTLAMGKPTPPGKDITVKLQEAQLEGDDKAIALVPTELLIDGQANQMPFILFKEASGWKVDMAASMERMMGGSMEQLTNALEDGMKQMAEGMKGVMEGMGEAMSQALGSSGESTEGDGSEPTHPDLAAFRQRMIDRLSTHWRVRADESALAACSPDLLKDALDALFGGILEVGANTDAGLGKLDAVRMLEIKKGYGPKRIEREGTTLVYEIGETEDGRSDFYDSSAIVAPLAEALEGII